MDCRHCRNMMKKVLRFDKDKSYKLYRCPNCYSETKQKNIFLNSINKTEKHTNKLKGG